MNKPGPWFFVMLVVVLLTWFATCVVAMVVFHNAWQAWVVATTIYVVILVGGAKLAAELDWRRYRRGLREVTPPAADSTRLSYGNLAELVATLAAVRETGGGSTPEYQQILDDVGMFYRVTNHFPGCDYRHAADACTCGRADLAAALVGAGQAV